MSNNRFLGLLDGVKTWFTAIQTSAGVVDAGKIAALDSSGRFNSTLLPVGIGAETQIMIAFEALAAGDFVNTFDNAGVLSCRKADNSNNRPANGFVPISVTASANAEVYLSGLNTSRSGLTSGAIYFLGTAGGVSLTAPSVSGSIIQALGSAASNTTIQFNFDAPIMIA